jgi:membrane fusion protein (multidrug efflux system)
MKSKFLLLFVVLATVGAAGYALFNHRQAQEKGDKTQSVEVIAAYEHTLSDSVESLGTAMANESVNITATVSETLAEINVDDGEYVEKDYVIARLAQAEELAQLAAAEARQQENQRELKRLKTLLQNKAAAQREYDERLTQIEITKREAEEIQARIADRTLRAPFEGVLGIRRLSVGALVQPGDLITTIDDLSRIKLDFTVPAVFLSSLKVGTPIEARSSALGETPFYGEIASVNSRIDPVTRSVLVRAIIPNTKHLLRPGLLMQVTLLKDQRTALVVPEECIIQRQKKHYVLVVDADKTVHQREVQTGVRHPGIIEIISGLNVGEIVITRGLNVVRAGQKVSISDTWESIRPPHNNENAAQEQPQEE